MFTFIKKMFNFQNVESFTTKEKEETFFFYKEKNEILDFYKDFMNKPVIIRSNESGVHYGTLETAMLKDGIFMCILKDSRRIYKWVGPNSISGLATNGTTKPEECQFTCEVSKIAVLEVCEICPVTEKGVESINTIPVW